MSKKLKMSIIVILILIVALAIIWVVYNHFKQEPADANVVDTNIADGNTGLDNIINELFEEVETNEVNKTENIQTTKPTNNNKNTISSTSANSGSKNETKDTETITETATSREEKAVKLVKETWGKDNSVYFSYQSIDNQGRYIVSVNKKDSTVLAWYYVDVDKGTVEQQ